MRSEDAVLRALKAGAISLDDLTSDAFEDLVVEIVRTEYAHFGESANITRDRRYDVDIVVREDRHGPFHTTDDLHFIEAKCYAKSLSLDTTAKAYCAALRYRPRTLTIACKSALQPQPLDYGRALFGDGRVTQLYILNLRHALSLRCLDRVEGASPGDVRAPLFRLQSWQVWRQGPFTAESIATSEIPRSVLVAAPDDVYELVIVAGVPSPAALPSFYLVCQSERVRPNEIVPFGDVLRICFRLPLAALARSAGLLELVAEDEQRLTAEEVRLPSLELAPSQRILPDLRHDSSSYWADRLCDPQGPRLLLLHGEGGVGKTYLCERIAALLHRNIGARCAHISVDAATSYLTFFRLILAVVFPPHIGGSQNLEFEESAIVNLLRSVEGSDNAGSDATHAVGEIPRVDLHAQITLAAKFVVGRAFPVAIFISNCQYLSPELLLGLRAFLIALDQFGWTNGRIVCEYRDQSGDAPRHLQQFAEAMLANRIGNPDVVHVERLAAGTMSTAAKKLFPGSDFHSVAAVLMSKTAGNPFLLENLLQHYANTGIIAGSPEAGFKVLDYARFSAAESTISRATCHLLAERIAYLDTTLAQMSGEPIFASRVLGLAALIGPKVDSCVWKVGGLDAQRNHQALDAFLQHGALTRNLDDGSVRFSHDIIRVTCLERFSKLSGCVGTVESVLHYLDATSPDAHELRGRLYAFIGREREASNEFNRGYELSTHGHQDFWMQKRCLLGIKSLYENHESLEDRERLMYVEILNKLAWADHNSGSSKHAAIIYEQALAAVEQASRDSEVWTAPVRAERTAALSHALLGLPLYTLDMADVPARAYSAIRNAQDLTRLGKILNRLVRLCTLFGYTSAGTSAAALASDIAGASRDPEVLAVLCTDIGDFYLHSEPEASKALRDRGLVEAKERRQQLHNEICAVVSDVYWLGNWAPESALNRTTQDARVVGVRNVSARLALYRGVKACAEGAMDVARWQFHDAEQIALLSGDTWIETLVHHNLAVLAYIEGKGSDNREVAHVEQAVTRLIHEMPDEGTMFDLIVGARAKAAALVSVASFDPTRLPLPLLQREPACCGTLNVLLYNLDRMGRARDLLSAWPLWEDRRRGIENGLGVLRSTNHPLVVHHRGRDSILAME